LLLRCCDGHHKMSDLGAASEALHSATRCPAPVWPAPAIRSLAKWSEVIMTTVTDELRELRAAINANATSERELTSDEIDTVSGGASSDNGIGLAGAGEWNVIAMLGWFHW
jgi:hypothetical protein